MFVCVCGELNVEEEVDGRDHRGQQQENKTSSSHQSHPPVLQCHNIVVVS